MMTTWDAVVGLGDLERVEEFGAQAVAERVHLSRGRLKGDDSQASLGFVEDVFVLGHGVAPWCCCAVRDAD